MNRIPLELKKIVLCTCLNGMGIFRRSGGLVQVGWAHISLELDGIFGRDRMGTFCRGDERCGHGKTYNFNNF